MKKTFTLLSAICLIAALVLICIFISYRFSGKLLLVPAGYFAFMAAAAERDEKKWRVAKRSLTALMIVGVLFVSVLCGIVVSDLNGDEAVACDYVVILGAGLRKDAPSRTLSDRLLRAYDYLEEFPDSVAIVSGSQGKDETVSEAYAMKKYLTQKGISHDRIIEEDKSGNTNENMLRSLEIINERGGGSIAVISSDYHMYRSRLLAENAGFSPVMLSAKTSLPFLFVNYLLREAFALVKAYLFFI